MRKELFGFLSVPLSSPSSQENSLKSCDSTAAPKKNVHVKPQRYKYNTLKSPRDLKWHNAPDDRNVVQSQILLLRRRLPWWGYCYPNPSPPEVRTRKDWITRFLYVPAHFKLPGPNWNRDQGNHETSIHYARALKAGAIPEKLYQ